MRSIPKIVRAAEALLAVVPLVFLSCSTAPGRQSFDVMITGARLFDGSGNPWFFADIGIKGDAIAAVGDLRGLSAGRTIEARGLAVAPGFIDMHTHCDEDLGRPGSRANVNYLTQGVTTVVTGNCGESPVDIAETADSWDKAGIGTNAVLLIGLSSVRTRVMGGDVRAPTPAETEEMKRLVGKAMREGAFGVSTGLEYQPGKYATTSEVIGLCAAAAPFGGLYSTHLRSEDFDLLPAVEEAISTGRAAGLRVNISHLRATGRPNWGRLKDAISLIAEARAGGLEITADIFPYFRSSTTTIERIFNIPDDLEPLAGIQKELASADLDPSVRAKLKERFSVGLAEALGDPSKRRRIEGATSSGVAGKSNWVARGGWDKFGILSCRTRPDYAGRMFRDLARETGRTEFDTAADLYLAEGRDLLISLSMMSEDDVRTGLAQPWTMVASDGLAMEPGSKALVHPCSYGTFTRVLAEYVRGSGTLGLEEAVRKMTSLPAQQLRLKDRGMVRSGMKADLVIFDPVRVSDQATFLDPNRYSEGIEYVLVNGRPAVERGVYNGVLNGRAIRREKGPF